MDRRVWQECRFLTCSVLPVRIACKSRCPFCFSRSSISSLARDATLPPDLEPYFSFAHGRGATRLVVTGGGEPLLKRAEVLHILQTGKRWFEETTLFTNGALLDEELAASLHAGGVSYVCYSRHHYDDRINRELMGPAAPRLRDFCDACAPLPIRATCVLSEGHIDSRDEVCRYLDRLAGLGIRQFTFKHTYTAYPRSLFAGSRADRWAREHHVDFDPFASAGSVIAQLPWGPCIRRLGELTICYYWEPTPEWEQAHRLCRSSNLLSDGRVYASLEDAKSLLFRLTDCLAPSLSTR
jgi:cyclic pyranopterin phosphate synthase